MDHFISWMKLDNSLAIMMKEMIKAFCDHFLFLRIHLYFDFNFFKEFKF